MATSGTGAIVTEAEAYKKGHVYLSSTSTKCLTYGKMADNANVYSGDTISSYGYFAGGWLPDEARSTSEVTPPTINRYKCVKYADIYNQIVRVPWTVTISEGVGGKTRADTIELRYYYKTSSTATETYEVCGTWSYGSNISGSASSNMYFEANPYVLYSGSVYSDSLKIWCGSTNAKQTWTYRLRTKTGKGFTGTWGDWVSVGNATSVLLTISGGFLYAMKTYNGIEFHVE